MRPSLLLCCALACGSTAPVHTALAPAAASALPAGLQSCAVLDDVQGQERCRLYDTQARAFTDAPDPLLHRVLTWERWQDKFSTVEGQLTPTRVHTEAMAPGDPESRWSDERYLASYDAMGDSVSYAEEVGISAAFRCAVTGAEADCARLEKSVRGSLSDFEATGIDGYLARAHFAGVPDGTRSRNGLSTQIRGSAQEAGVFDIPAEVVPKMPAYYSAGIDNADGSHTAARPSWYGHPSIDSSIGPLNSWPVAWGLLKDPELKARMARQYGCYLKRLKIFRIINLSKNAQLQHDIANFLGQGVVHTDPDDPDLTKTDEVWGFYQPQFNWLNAATFSRTCPDKLPVDADPSEIIDVTRVGYDGKLFDLILRQAEGAEQADSIDYTYFVNVRAGDAALLLAHATAAALITGDSAFLRWRDEILIGKANARAVARTEGEFVPPVACRSYYRTPAVYTAVFGRMLIEGDAAERAYWANWWTQKLGARELSNNGDHLFALMGAVSQGQSTPAAQAGLAELALFGGAPDHLEDPRRNYRRDLSASPPDGYQSLSPPAADLKFCQDGVQVLGVQIPGSTVDPAYRYADRALPLMLRQNNEWMWSQDPFQLNPQWHAQGPGFRQYSGLDLSEPYWIARHAGYLPDPHQVLAWGPK